MIGFWWEHSSLSTDVHLLAVSSHGREERETVTEREEERDRESKQPLSSLLIRTQILTWELHPQDLIISERPHLLIPSHWCLRFYPPWILGGHKHAGQNTSLLSLFYWTLWNPQSLVTKYPKLSLCMTFNVPVLIKFWPFLAMLHSQSLKHKSMGWGKMAVLREKKWKYL